MFFESLSFGPGQIRGSGMLGLHVANDKAAKASEVRETGWTRSTLRPDEREKICLKQSTPV